MTPEICWDAEHNKALEDSKNRFFKALDSLTKEERSQIHLAHGEILGPPWIKAKIDELLKT